MNTKLSGAERLSIFTRALLLSTLLLLSCAGRPIYRAMLVYPEVKQPLLTVKLLETDKGIVISPRGGEAYTVRAVLQGEETVIYQDNADLHPIFWNKVIVLREKSLELEGRALIQLSISPLDAGSHLLLDGKPYRGALEILPSPPDQETNQRKGLVVLNVVNVEDYLKGVVPAEIGRLSEKEFEALKAQAVAARTYALSHIGQYEEWGYDLVSSVMDQVYRGIEGEDPLVNRAIEETEGIVLTREGRLIDAYYHANCGGKTAYIEKVWDKEPKPYLVPVNDDFCRWAGSYEWVERWNRLELESNISAYLDTLVTFPGGTFSRLADLRIIRRSPSGRVDVLEVVTDLASYDLHEDRIRWALRRGGRPHLITRSTLFDLEIERDSDGSIGRVTALGRGTGHGVGACQTGVIGMARQGYPFDEILAHYYTGVKLRGWGE